MDRRSGSGLPPPPCAFAPPPNAAALLPPLQIGFACGVIIVTSLDLYSNPSLADAGTIALAEGETKLGIYSPAQLEAAGKAALNSDADALSGEVRTAQRCVCVYLTRRCGTAWD